MKTIILLIAVIGSVFYCIPHHSRASATEGKDEWKKPSKIWNSSGCSYADQRRVYIYECNTNK